MNTNNENAMITLIIVLGAQIMGAIIVIGGFYFIAAEKFAEVELSVFSLNFSSTSIGVSMIIIGVMLVFFIGDRALRMLRLHRSSGGLGGNAGVIGDGEARGGKGGHSGSFGPGGKGGDANVIGKGKAVGGDGG